MARTVLSPQNIVRTGLNPTYSAADGTNHHSFNNTGEYFFVIVKNGGGGSINFVADCPLVVDGNNIPDITVAVPAGSERWIGPFPRAVYGQADSGNSIADAILFQFSGVTSVTVGLFKLGSPVY